MASYHIARDYYLVRSVYHFTHIKNLASILKGGVLQPDAAVADRNDYADPSIKQKRRLLKVMVEPFGYLADYTPFYFIPQSPMLAVVATRDIQGRPPVLQEHLAMIELFFKPKENTIINGSASIITSRHPLSRGVIIERATPDNIKKLVNWNAISSPNKWSVPGMNPEECQKLRQAELLVHGGLQINGANLLIFVRTDAAATKVETLVKESGHEINVEANKEYFHHYLP